ncbi:type IV pilus twitching motility protein PilT [Nocardioides litoris]|uniref:type IV pilus twitching motility protein PilT n=1 Tax=Nocardioides litoris TaxID=1926648 RepID=UPI001121E5DE|nr:type IV pilus twitching motility protein PilT [Nocardioides litoris]
MTEPFEFEPAPYDDPAAGSLSLPVAPAGLPVAPAGLPVAPAGLPVAPAGLPVAPAGLPLAPAPAAGLPLAPAAGLPVTPVAAAPAPEPAPLPVPPVAPVAPVAVAPVPGGPAHAAPVAVTPTTVLPVVPAQPSTSAPVVSPVVPVASVAAPAAVTEAAPVSPVAPAVHVAPVQPVPTTAGGHGAPVLAPAAATPGVRAVDRAEEAEQQIALDQVLGFMVDAGGSDLHLSAGAPPTIRVRGEMQRVPGYEPLTGEQIQTAVFGVMTSKHQKAFEERWELDFAYTVPGKARFRVNVLRQRGSVGAVMRTIPWEIKSLEQLALPSTIGDFAQLERGLVLVTGPTGSGKSTTLAAVIDKANRTRSGHIMTIEDPVEFLHQHQGCIVNQREVGDDTHSFADALKHVLRQDPDIILVGEMRDLETISVALTAAETGHLVFGTLHTQSAAETITRVIDVFPPEQQQQVRTQLAGTLQGVVCQTLCRTADGRGRQAAVEIMMATPAIRSQIREDKLAQIPGTLQAGAKHGMQTLNQDLARLVRSGRITYQAGLDKCSDKEDFIGLVGGSEADVDKHIARQQFATGGFGGLS